ncbi:MAG TPA: helix-turn-helix transcriptional regulator [Phycisphaerales bacterium]|nr:helix-turn-helix transcriptional regulator [Phycisphaerales bacterium]
MKIEKDLLRGAGPLAVLKLLERGEMYGYELAEALTRQTAGVLEMGQSTLYPMLYNLEAKGLIASRWARADSGRERRYYSLTSNGRRRLSEDAEKWAALAGAMAALGLTAGPARALAGGGAP